MDIAERAVEYENLYDLSPVVSSRVTGDHEFLNETVSNNETKFENRILTENVRNTFVVCKSDLSNSVQHLSGKISRRT